MTQPPDEQARLAAVRRYQILDTPPEGSFDRVAAVAARVFDVPIATVTIVDEDRIWFKAAQGLHGMGQVRRDPGLCASAILQPDPYVIADASLDPRTVDNPLVRGELGLRFYAAAPITTHDGYRLGTVNAIDRQPRKATTEELATLQDLAAIVVDTLELRLEAIRTVDQERRIRKRAEQERSRLEADRQAEEVGEYTDRVLRIARQRSPNGLRLHGEVDQSNLATLARALDAVTGGGGDVHLDLSRLEFIDVAGIRLLTRTARQMPAGRCLVLDGTAPYLRRIISLVGWDRTPGLKIGGDQA